MRNFLLLLVAFGLGAKRHWHIFLAVILGIGLGIALPVDQTHPAQIYHTVFEVVGQVFIRLITMLALPLMISSLILGITSLGDGRQMGKIGLKTVFLFFLTMIIASSIAIAIGYYIQPGTYFPPDFISTMRGQAAPYFPTLGSIPHVGEHPDFSSMLENISPLTLQSFIIGLIPENPFTALANSNYMPIIMFTILVGVAMSRIGDAARPFVALFESIFAATMKVMDWLMVLAVPGVFALSFTVFSHSGLGLLYNLGPYVGCVLLALGLQTFVVHPLLLWIFARVNFVDLYRAVSEAILVGFGTASSSATLPVTLACIERRAGVSNRIASFVMPTGATMNMNGTTMFEVIAVMFLAQLYGIEMTPITIGLIWILAVVAAISAAGVPSSGFITMAIIINGLGQFSPVQVATGLSILWSIDRILDMCRTAVNVVDDCSVATIIASSEGELNRDLLTSKETWKDVI